VTTATAHYTLANLAERFGLRLRGDDQMHIDGVATLAGATSSQVSFLANPRYRGELAGCRAAAIILRAEDAEAFNGAGAVLIAKDPYVAFAKVAALFDRVAAPAPGVHPSCVVAADARISASASVGPFCVIDAGASIDDGVVIGAHCHIGSECHVGSQSRLVSRVTLVAQVCIGKRVLLHPGVVIGADGFGLAFDSEAFDHGGWIKVPQQGGVRIGDDCEIGANTTIDRGALEDTVLEEDVRLDNQIQIAHNVRIGAHTAMAGCSAVAGSATIGRYCLIGGGAGILGHLTIADKVTITSMSLVTHSIHAAGEYSSGTPIQDNRSWRRNAARFKHLDDTTRRVHALEKELKK
jgi:UDP-3-O-[3-hydroxymyristoyl] glucosamine N-acyltransferase